MNAYRKVQKWQSIVDRGGPGVALCDLCCVQPGSEYHEIMSRGRTVKSEEARVLSFNKYICALLCSDCHTGSQNAHNPEAATTLLRRNIELYGYANVRAAFDAVNTALASPTNIVFPEESPNEMSATRTDPIFYAKMICDYFATLPDYYTDNIEEVQAALGLSDVEFQMGLNWCTERGIITTKTHRVKRSD